MLHLNTLTGRLETSSVQMNKMDQVGTKMSKMLLLGRIGFFKCSLCREMWRETIQENLTIPVLTRMKH